MRTRNHVTNSAASLYSRHSGSSIFEETPFDHWSDSSFARSGSFFATIWARSAAERFRLRDRRARASAAPVPPAAVSPVSSLVRCPFLFSVLTYSVESLMARPSFWTRDPSPQSFPERPSLTPPWRNWQMRGSGEPGHTGWRKLALFSSALSSSLPSSWLSRRKHPPKPRARTGGSFLPIRGSAQACRRCDTERQTHFAEVGPGRSRRLLACVCPARLGGGGGDRPGSRGRPRSAPRHAAPGGMVDRRLSGIGLARLGHGSGPRPGRGGSRPADDSARRLGGGSARRCPGWHHRGEERTQGAHRAPPSIAGVGHRVEHGVRLPIRPRRR